MICYLDGSYSQISVTGLSRYTDNLLLALDEHPKVLNGELKCIVFGYRSENPFRIKLNNLQFEYLPINYRAHLYANALLKAPNLVNYFKNKPNIVHFHDVFRYTCDIPGVKTFVTVHDLSSLIINKHYSFRSNFLKVRALDRLKNSCSTIISVSENTKSDLIRYSLIEPNRIHNIHLGLDPIFENNLILESNPVFPTKSYALFVGRYHPRKNTENIINAYALWAPTIPIDLVLAGDGLQKNLEQFPGYKNLTDSLKARVKFMGRVSDSELVSLYKNAFCFIFPSFHEGFGLPVVEAMSLKCPVITSPNGSLREVASDAAIYIDPTKFESISNEIIKLFFNEDYYRSYSLMGFERSKIFSWNFTAKKTVDLFME